MAVETDEFIIGNETFNYIESREIRADRMRPPPSKGGLKSAYVTCKGCGHSWTARQFGGGNFSSFIGGVIVTCPTCSAEGKIENKLFG